MDNEKAFRDAFKAHGLPLQTDHLHVNQSTGLNEQLKFYKHAAPDVYTGFLSNQRFNAVATKYQDKALIGIYIGTINFISQYAYCLLSDPNVLPKIGNPNEESIEPRFIEELRDSFQDVKLGNPFRDMSHLRYLPRNPIRLRAAQNLAWCAYLILFYHELAHIHLCHLEFIRDELGAEEHQEITALPLSESEAILLRTLEWDADNSAFATSLKMWRLLYEAVDYSALDSLGPEVSWYVASQLLFFVMDFVQPINRRGLLSTHQSPETRKINAQIVFKQLGFDPELSSFRDIADANLVPWIVQNGFPSSILEDAENDVSFVESTKKELSEAFNHYRLIMGRLYVYQEHRLKSI